MKEITPAEPSSKWAMPPEGGDKYRALVALRCLKLSGSEFRLIIALIDRANIRSGRCDPGTERLMADTNLCKRSVAGARAKLRKKGIINYRLRGLGSASYQVNWQKLNEIFQRHCRNPAYDQKRIAAQLKNIERTKLASGSIAPEHQEWLDDIVEQHNGHLGDGLGGWAYRLLTEA
jgi:hypothetical protein